MNGNRDTDDQHGVARLNAARKGVAEASPWQQNRDREVVAAQNSPRMLSDPGAGYSAGTAPSFLTRLRTVPEEVGISLGVPHRPLGLGRRARFINFGEFWFEAQPIRTGVWRVARRHSP